MDERIFSEAEERLRGWQQLVRETKDHMSQLRREIDTAVLGKDIETAVRLQSRLLALDIVCYKCEREAARCTQGPQPTAWQLTQAR